MRSWLAVGAIPAAAIEHSPTGTTPVSKRAGDPTPRSLLSASSCFKRQSTTTEASGRLGRYCAPSSGVSRESSRTKPELAPLQDSRSLSEASVRKKRDALSSGNCDRTVLKAEIAANMSPRPRASSTPGQQNHQASKYSKDWGTHTPPGSAAPRVQKVPDPLQKWFAVRKYRA